MPDAMKHAFPHGLDEVDHPDMALRTYKALGGDEQRARNRRMTPASFAMCAACDRVVEEVSGVAYPGFMYPFESMTPVLTQRAMEWLGAKGIGKEKREFIDVHAVDDIAHQRSMRNLIGKIVSKYPGAAEEIEYSAQVFFSVYPAPIWQAVVERAKGEMSGTK
jgi:pyrroloquinoline quinone (PQQ) biosynthesis protein C